MTKQLKKFFGDLAKGKWAEKLVCETFILVGFPSHLETDKICLPYWDIKAEYNSQYMTIEVKYDEYEHKSGNLAIEVYNTRLQQPSGIMRTRAFFWTHVLHDKSMWLTRTQTLRNYILNKPPVKIIISGGDNNATLYLYDSSILRSNVFTRVDTLSPKLFRQFIIREWEIIFDGQI